MVLEVMDRMELVMVGRLAGGMDLTTANCTRKTKNVMFAVIWRKHPQYPPLTLEKDLQSMGGISTCLPHRKQNTDGSFMHVRTWLVV